MLQRFPSSVWVRALAVLLIELLCLPAPDLLAASSSNRSIFSGKNASHQAVRERNIRELGYRQQMQRERKGEEAPAQAAVKGPLSNATLTNLSAIRIPEQDGQILEAWQPDGLSSSSEAEGRVEKQPTVIILQDLHTQKDAQLAEGRLLEYLHTTYQVGRVAAEGAEGPFAVEEFREVFQEPLIREMIAETFLTVGEMTGFEYQIVTRDLPVDIYGIEDTALHEANIDAYRQVLDVEPNVRPVIQRIQEALIALQPKLYSDDVMNLSRQVVAFERGQLTLPQVLTELERAARKAGVPYDTLGPNLARLQQVQAEEQSLNRQVVEQQVGQLLREFSARIQQGGMTDTLRELQTLTRQFQQQQLAAAYFYPRLLELAESSGIDVGASYGGLQKFSDYLTRTRSLESHRIGTELDVVTWAVLDSLAQSDDERTLLRLVRHAELLGELFVLHLTPDQLDYYQAHRREFSLNTFRAFMNPQLARHGFGLRIEDSDEAIDARLPLVDRFYELARQRDRVIVDNTLRWIQSNQLQVTSNKHGASSSGSDEGGGVEKPEAVLLVAGGFHTPGVTALLRERSVPYVVITPTASGVSDEALYHRLMRGEIAGGDQLLGIAQSTQSYRRLGGEGIAVQSDKTPHLSPRRAGGNLIRDSLVAAAGIVLLMVMIVNAAPLNTEALTQLGSLVDHANALAVKLPSLGVESLADLPGLDAQFVIDWNAAMTSAEQALETRQIPAGLQENLTSLVERLQSALDQTKYIGAGTFLIGQPGGQQREVAVEVRRQDDGETVSNNGRRPVSEITLTIDNQSVTLQNQAGTITVIGPNNQPMSMEKSMFVEIMRGVFPRIDVQEPRGVIVPGEIAEALRGSSLTISQVAAVERAVWQVGDENQDELLPLREWETQIQTSDGQQRLAKVFWLIAEIVGEEPVEGTQSTYFSANTITARLRTDETQSGFSPSARLAAAGVLQENDVTVQVEDALVAALNGAEASFGELDDGTEQGSPVNTERPGVPQTVDITQPDTLREFVALGNKAEVWGRTAVVLMAGGSGTRLFDSIRDALRSIMPKKLADKLAAELTAKYTKPTYPFTTVSGDSALQMQLEIFAAIQRELGVTFPIIIGVSDDTEAGIQAMLEQNNYFGMDANYIRTAKQKMWPIHDADGKIVMKDDNTVAMGPNGNGGALKAALTDENVAWIAELLKDQVADPKDIQIYFGNGDGPITADILHSVMGALNQNQETDLVGVGYPYKPKLGIFVALKEMIVDVVRGITGAVEYRFFTGIVNDPDVEKVSGLKAIFEKFGPHFTANAGFYAGYLLDIAEKTKTLPIRMDQKKNVNGKTWLTQYLVGDKKEPPTVKFETQITDFMRMASHAVVLRTDEGPLLATKDTGRLALVRDFFTRMWRARALDLGATVADEAMVEFHPWVFLGNRVQFGQGVEIRGPAGVDFHYDFKTRKIQMVLYTRYQPESPVTLFDQAPAHRIVLFESEAGENLVVPAGVVIDGNDIAGTLFNLQMSGRTIPRAAYSTAQFRESEHARVVNLTNQEEVYIARDSGNVLNLSTTTLSSDRLEGRVLMLLLDGREIARAPIRRLAGRQREAPFESYNQAGSHVFLTADFVGLPAGISLDTEGLTVQMSGLATDALDNAVEVSDAQTFTVTRGDSSVLVTVTGHDTVNGTVTLTVGTQQGRDDELTLQTSSSERPLEGVTWTAPAGAMLAVQYGEDILTTIRVRQRNGEMFLQTSGDVSVQPGSQMQSWQPMAGVEGVQSAQVSVNVPVAGRQREATGVIYRIDASQMTVRVLANPDVQQSNWPESGDLWAEQEAEASGQTGAYHGVRIADAAETLNSGGELWGYRLPAGHKACIVSNVTNDNYWQRWGVVVQGGQVVMIPEQRLDGDELDLLVVSGTNDKGQPLRPGILTVRIENGRPMIPKTITNLYAFPGPRVVERGAVTTADMKNADKDHPARRPDMVNIAGSFSSSWILFGVTRSGELLMTALAGDSQTGVPQAAVDDAVQLMLQAGAYDVVLGGGGPDVQVWTEGRLQVEGNWTYGQLQTPDQTRTQRRVNTVLVVSSPEGESTAAASVFDAAAVEANGDLSTVLPMTVLQQADGMPVDQAATFVARHLQSHGWTASSLKQPGLQRTLVIALGATALAVLVYFGVEFFSDSSIPHVDIEIEGDANIGGDWDVTPAGVDTTSEAGGVAPSDTLTIDETTTSPDGIKSTIFDGRRVIESANGTEVTTVFPDGRTIIEYPQAGISFSRLPQSPNWAAVFGQVAPPLEGDVSQLQWAAQRLAEFSAQGIAVPEDITRLFQGPTLNLAEGLQQLRQFDDAVRLMQEALQQAGEQPVIPQPILELLSDPETRGGALQEFDNYMDSLKTSPVQPGLEGDGVFDPLQQAPPVDSGANEMIKALVVTPFVGREQPENFGGGPFVGAGAGVGVGGSRRFELETVALDPEIATGTSSTAASRLAAWTDIQMSVVIPYSDAAQLKGSAGAFKEAVAWVFDQGVEPEQVQLLVLVANEAQKSGLIPAGMTAVTMQELRTIPEYRDLFKVFFSSKGAPEFTGLNLPEAIHYTVEDVSLLTPQEFANRMKHSFQTYEFDYNFFKLLSSRA